MVGWQFNFTSSFALVSYKKAHLVLAVRVAVGGVRRVSTAASVTLGTKLSVLADFRITSADACGRGRLSDPHLRTKPTVSTKAAILTVSATMSRSEGYQCLKIGKHQSGRVRVCPPIHNHSTIIFTPSATMTRNGMESTSQQSGGVRVRMPIHMHNLLASSVPPKAKGPKWWS